MNKKSILALATGALAFGGCANESASPDRGISETLGAADFNVEIPGTDDAINAADLTLDCPGFTQTHVLDLSESVPTASFDGIAPGQCTATLAGSTEGGFDCSGEELIEIVADQVAQATITLVCGGAGGSSSGGAFVGVEIESDVCPDKVQKIYAIPGTVAVDDSTTVQLELLEGQAIDGATAEVSGSSDGTADVAVAASCNEGASNCWDVTCTGGGDVVLDVTAQEGECEDAEQILVVCDGEPPVIVCGDGVVEGDEECDDGNLENGDGCDENCVIEPPGGECGDGNLDEGEECDDGNLENGDGCDENCVIEPVEDACFDCITDPEGTFYTVLGSQVDICLEDPNCELMLTCMTETKCANAATGETNPAECICGYGADIDACFAGDVADAQGVCLDELLTFAPEGLTVPDLANYFVNSTNPSGLAYSLYNPAATNAQAECNADEDCGGTAVDPSL